jgi:hypothetical protein
MLLHGAVNPDDARFSSVKFELAMFQHGKNIRWLQ